MKKILLFILLISCVVAQPRKPVQWRDLQEAIKDSIRNAAGSIGDSLTVLRAEIGDTANVYIADSLNNITLYNGLDNSVYSSARKIGQKIIANTTILAAYTADSNGTVVYLKSPPGYYAQIDSAYPEQGGISFNNGTTGKQWILVDYLRTKTINPEDFGIKTTNSAASNNTAMSNMLSFLRGISSNDSVFVQWPHGRYEFSTTFSPGQAATSAEISLSMKGVPGTRLVMTTNDTLFSFNSFFSMKFEDIAFVGNGKSNSAVGISSRNTSGNLIINSCEFDSFSVGLDAYDLTTVLGQSITTRANNVGIKAEYNSDGWTLNGRSSHNDTAFVVLNSSNDDFKLLNWIWGQDSVGIVFRGGGALEIDGGYAEDVRHMGYIGTNDGNAANGLRNINIHDWVYQGSAPESGFTFYDNDFVRISGCRVVATCDTSYFNLNTNTATVTTHSNYFSGTNIDVRYANDNVKYTTSAENLNLGFRGIQRANVNNISTPVNTLEMHSLTDTVYIKKAGIVGSTNRTFTRYSYEMMTPTQTIIGLDGSSVYNYFDLWGGTVGAPETAASGLRGHLYYRGASRDVPFLCIQFETGVYKQIDILTGKPFGEGDMAGTAAFTTSDIHDTLLVTGVHPDSDYVFLTPVTATPDSSSTILSYNIATNGDTIFVHRPAGTISGLNYVWRRMKNRIK